MKLVSWNVNGIRACLKKDFMTFFENIDADLFCIQETKAHSSQVEINTPGYTQFWNSAEKKGYSGTLIFAKNKPINSINGLGIEKHDTEGRVITLEYENFYLNSVKEDSEHTQNEELNKMAKILEDFEPNGLMN